MNRKALMLALCALSGSALAEDAICIGTQSLAGSFTVYEGSASSEIAGGTFSAEATTAPDGDVSLSHVSISTVTFDGDDVTDQVDIDIDITGSVDDFETGEMEWSGDITLSVDDDCGLTPLTGSWLPDSPASSGDTFYFIDGSFGASNSDVAASDGCSGFQTRAINNRVDDINLSVVASELDITFSECTGASCYVDGELQADGDTWTETRYCPFPSASTCQVRSCTCDDGSSDCDGWISLDDL